jgi:abortive infection bacteriophage resistance protein
MSNGLIPFAKPALSLDDQLKLLISRGLKVHDRSRAYHYLRYIGYYRLSGYFRPFQYPNDSAHTFRPGTTFDQILQLYIFDRKLRLLVMDPMERIEVAIRSAMSNIMSQNHGPHWYLDRNLFNVQFTHEDFLETVRKETGYYNLQRRNVFCRHYFSKYDQPELPPSWMVMEVISFGTLSHVFSYLQNREDQKAIGKEFNLHYTVLKSWLHTLTYLRNICAHHERLWNRVFTIKPKKNKVFAKHFENNQKFYAQAAVINVFLKVIAGGSSWQERLKLLLEEYPQIDKGRMGFPKGWTSDPFWGLS